MATLACVTITIGDGSMARMTGKAVGVATPSSVGAGNFMYQKVALDTGSGSYYTWVTPDIDASPDIAPPIGPWGNIAVLSRWVVEA